MTDLRPYQTRLRALHERGVAKALLLRSEALLLRMQGQDAALCAALEPRLCVLLEQAERAVPTIKPAPPLMQASPLAELLQVWNTASDNGAATLEEPAEQAIGLPAPPMLEDARRVWRAVRARSQLRESLAQPQEHAGPLNSGRLVLRMIDAMQAASPDYLECLLTYIDVLAALEPLAAVASGDSGGAAPKRSVRARKRRE